MSVSHATPPTTSTRSTFRTVLACALAIALAMTITVPAEATQNDSVTNNYTRSRNSQDVGITGLMDSLTNCGQETDTFLPVWGRNVRVGLIDSHFIDGSYQPAGAPRDVKIISKAGINGYSSGQPVALSAAQGQSMMAQHPSRFIQNGAGSHARDTYRALVTGTNGARGVTEVQSLTTNNPKPNANGTFSFSTLPSANRGFDFSQWWANGEPAAVYEAPHVFNTSTVIDGTDQDIRGMELLADSHDTLWVTAAGNGPDKSPFYENVEFDMAAMYNGVTVGAGPLTWGVFETSYSTQGTWGTNNRLKPDIAFSNGNPFTSFSAPAVGAYAARLREAVIAQFGANTAAIKSETLKAILLSGATKRIVEDSSYGWSRSVQRPIDEHFGVGIAHLYNSYTIAMAGEQPGWRLQGPVAPAPTMSSANGWDHYEQLAPGQHVVYTFPAVDADGDALNDLNATLTWHLDVAPDLSSHQLADMILRVFSTDANGARTWLQHSNSRIDNVEHLYLPNPDPDAVSYTLLVTNPHSSPVATDYALAWRHEGPRAECTIVEDQDIDVSAAGGPVHTAAITLRGGETVSSSVDIAVREPACGTRAATYVVTAPDGAATTFDLQNPNDHDCAQLNGNWTVHTVELDDAYLTAGWTTNVSAEWTVTVEPGSDPHTVGFTRVRFSPHGYLS